MPVHWLGRMRGFEDVRKVYPGGRSSWHLSVLFGPPYCFQEYYYSKLVIHQFPTSFQTISNKFATTFQQISTEFQTD